MKKFVLVFSLIALIGAVSCSKDNKPEPVPAPELFNGVYVLNNGSFGSNNSSLTKYNSDNKSVAQNVFANTNGLYLGDTAMDVLVYGSKMYITVKESGVIFVTDLAGAAFGAFTLDNYVKPNWLTSSNGKVYASYYDGAVVQIDTVDFSYKTAKVGDNPEQLKVANGKLFVANSGGMNYPNYGTTVSVVDINSFSVVEEIEVGVNPYSVEVDDSGNVYVITRGDYGAIPAQLVKINSSSYNKEVLELKYNGSNVTPSNISMGKNNNMYIIATAYDANWNLTAIYYTYNVSSGNVSEFTTTASSIVSPYCIFADKNSGNVYIGDAGDYQSMGDMFIFSQDGNLVNVFETGISPISVAFMTK